MFLILLFNHIDKPIPEAIMGKSSKSILLLFSFLLISQPDSNAQGFAFGQAEYEKGNEDLTLQVWHKSWLESDKDPRIGFAYIELAAGLKRDSLYKRAEKMYFSSLERSMSVNGADLIKEELFRLKPIIGKKEHKKWMKLLRKKDKSLLNEIREFWQSSNPFISSDYNERLIEHWERVFLAKKEYAINNKSGFGSDDRGVLFIKLGKPTLIKTGNVSLSDYSDPITGVSIPLQNNLHFSYEIWYYNHISYVFGRPGTGGAFGLQDGILDLIPEAGNRPIFYFDPLENLIQVSSQENQVRNGSSGNTPATQQVSFGGVPGMKQISRQGASLLLQYSVLEQINDVDPFYFDLYNRMSSDLIRSDLNGNSNIFNSTAATQNLKYKAQEKNWTVIKNLNTPVTTSETKPFFKAHDLKVHYFNLLGEDFSSIFLVLTEHINHNSIEFYLSQKENGTLESIIREDHFVTYDSTWSEIEREGFRKPLVSPDYSTFDSYLINSGNGIVVFQSSFIETSSGNVNSESDSEEYIISSSPLIEIPEGTSLIDEMDQKGFTVSDLILAKDQEENTETRIPFFPNLDNVFEESDELIVYFETYGIPKENSYELEYVKRGGDNKIRMELSSESSSNKVWFKIELDEINYPEGEHTLDFKFRYRGKEVKRTVSLKLNRNS